jgi:sodium-dependent phosphate cotransporter
VQTTTHVAERRGPGPLTWLSVASLVYLLLIGVGVIGEGFKWVSGGNEGAAAIFAFASSPLVGVILGILATAMVQSSSTVTSVIVGLVAGGVPVSIAVPMIMGANMGTTITNTIVSLGALKEREMFNRSFQAATVHDFFNLYSIVIFLPIEVLLHPLERLAGAMSAWFSGGSGAAVRELNFLGAITKPVASLVIDAFQFVPVLGGYLAILAGIGMVIASVLYLGRTLRQVMTAQASGIVQLAVGRSALAGVASGTAITVLVQSSSTTTSLIVPLAGAGILSTRQVFPFTMGANIGTCITALLAATAVTGPYQQFALQIALVHLLYNLFGVAAFLLVPWLRRAPVRSAEWLGNRTEQHRGWALGYVFTVFFLVPGLVLGGEMLFRGREAALPSAGAGTRQQLQEDVEKAGLNIE